MLCVMMSDGRMLEFPEAGSAEVENDLLSLVDGDGTVIASLSAKILAAYGDHEAMAQYRDEQPH
jgi:hypothetical protein